MRAVLALCLVTLVACGARDRGPAWPKQTDPEADGGESLAPRTSAVAVAADKTDDDTKDDAKPAETKADDAKPVETKATDTKPTESKPATDDVIIIDDIVIEIED